MSNSSKSESIFQRIQREEGVLKSPLFKKKLPSLRPLAEGDAQKARQAARDTIDTLVIRKSASTLDIYDLCALSLSCDWAISTLNDYATLHEDHISAVQTMLAAIDAYLCDPARTRPCSFLMQASPGAGKSHFIQCIAKSLLSRGYGPTASCRAVTPVTFNMASMGSIDELIRPLDAARNVKINDGVPLLFLDEFDADPRNIALLLPLLWDGSLGLCNHELSLGKSIIVLAGSSKMLPDAISQGRSMKPEMAHFDSRTDKLPKIVDLLSRINGSILSIPSLTERPHDKIPIVFALLQRRFGTILRSIPWNLLHFVAQVAFRYDVRSITHLVECIPFAKDTVCLKNEDLHLPFATRAALETSSLIYHLICDGGPDGVVQHWKRTAADSQQVPLPPMRSLQPYDKPEQLLASRVLDIEGMLKA